jgi:MFS family permease
MGSSNRGEPKEESETRWHISLIPIFMAIGSAGLLLTLVALTLGASVVEIGILTAAGAVATFVFSTVWGRFSDISGTRKKYLIFLYTILIPVFLTLSLANSVLQLIFLYTLLAGITSGITPVAVNYTVECCHGKGWREGGAKYNSVTTIGNLLGLLAYTVGARLFETQWLFYISAALCFLAAIVLWRTGQETKAAAESMRSHNTGKPLSPQPVRRNLNIRRVELPKNLKQLTPLQLLFLATFVHWTGITWFAVGQVPLMKSLGLTDSLILAVNCVAGAMQAIAFVSIAIKVKSDHRRLLRRVILVRGGLILCWAAFPIFLIHPVSFVFVFPLVISMLWSIFYTMIWLPITTFAISQAPAARRGSVQGELLSAIGVANAISSALGGLVITALGYTIGFAIAAVIAMLTIPIISRIDMD